MRHFFYDSLKRFLMVFVATLAFVAPTFAANLPSGYTELEYLEGGKDSNAYINLGYAGTLTMQTLLRASVNQMSSSDSVMFGASDEAAFANGNPYSVDAFSSKAMLPIGKYVSGTGARFSVTKTLTSGTIYDFKLNYPSAGQFCVDDTCITATPETPVTSENLYLFGFNGGGEYSSSYSARAMRVYALTQWDNGNMIHNWKPVRRDDGVLGMYDVATNTFKENAGTGTFVAGPTACPGGTLETHHESGLPVGYTKLDYIQSDGNSWIDTGIKGNMSYKYDIEFQQLDARQYRNWGAFNQQSYSGGPNMSLTYAYGFGVRWTVTGNNQQMVDGLSSLDTNRHHLVIDNGYVTWDGVSKGRSTGHQNNYQLNYNLFLGTINPGGTTPTSNAKSKYYSYKVWNGNGDLIQNFVPAKNSSGVVGMYDLVGGQFFTNAGTGTFTAGNTVSDPIVEQCVGGGAIKIATTKYTEDAFAGLMTTLSEAITKVTNIVDTTVQQATEIGNLATTKQDRPDTDCPEGRKCLLIMGADNKPHWYLIQE